MHVLLIEPSYYTQYPPLGLLKLSAYHKHRGDTVQFIRGTAGLMNVHKEPKKVYVTSLFTWAWQPVHDAVHLAKILFPRSEISLGGVYASLYPEHAKTTGVNVHTGIFPEMEDILPDYELVPEWHQKKRGSVFFTHRGCVRTCHFCAVPALEGKPIQLRKSNSIRHLIHPDHWRVILWDNNILGEPHWRDVVDELAEIKTKTIAPDKRIEVDFNQGLDARFINEDVAAHLSKVRMPVVRVAYDYPKMGHAVKKAIECLEAVGFSGRKIISYVLFNFEDKPEDLFERVRNLLEWGACAYPMRFQPLNTLEKDVYVGPGWTKEQLEMVATARRVIGIGGAFPPYEGLVKKFLKARNFEEAFGLWHTKQSHDRKKKIKMSESYYLFADMARDHEFPISQ